MRFIRWLQMPLTSGEKKTGAGGLAQVALEALESVGQVVAAGVLSARARARDGGIGGRVHDGAVRRQPGAHRCALHG